MLIDLSRFNWQDIQQKHDQGLRWCRLHKYAGISRALLHRAKNEGWILQRKFKQQFSDEQKQRISDALKKHIAENLDQHIWNISKKKSIPCEKFKELLRKHQISYVEEYQPLSGRFFMIDIAFPDKKIGIEINGNQHYNADGTLKPYYQDRHDLIVANGWQLIELHYSIVYDEQRCDNIVANLKKDHDLNLIDYSFYIRTCKRRATQTKEQRHKNQQKRFEDQRKLWKQRQMVYVDLILKSGIDFTKLGWIGQVAKIINKKPPKVSWWLKRVMPDFYQQHRIYGRR